MVFIYHEECSNTYHKTDCNQKLSPRSNGDTILDVEYKDRSYIINMKKGRKEWKERMEWSYR